MVANRVALAAFAASAVVQYNDPDPWPWILIYGAGAVACALAERRPPAWPLPAAVGLVALIWSATLLPGVVREARFADAFARMEGDRPIVEETREALGLLLMAGWMAVLIAPLPWKGRGDSGGKL